MLANISAEFPPTFCMSSLAPAAISVPATSALPSLLATISADFPTKCYRSKFTLVDVIIMISWSISQAFCARFYQGHLLPLLEQPSFI